MKLIIMAKQTAVLWLAIKLYEKMKMNGDGKVFDELLKQAKTMEKEQITDAYIMGSYDMVDKEFRPEQYYNEIFKT